MHRTPLSPEHVAKSIEQTVASLADIERSMLALRSDFERMSEVLRPAAEARPLQGLPPAVAAPWIPFQYMPPPAAFEPFPLRAGAVPRGAAEVPGPAPVAETGAAARPTPKRRPKANGGEPAGEKPRGRRGKAPR